MKLNNLPEMRETCKQARRKTMNGLRAPTKLSRKQALQGKKRGHKRNRVENQPAASFLNGDGGTDQSPSRARPKNRRAHMPNSVTALEGARSCPAHTSFPWLSRESSLRHQDMKHGHTRSTETVLTSKHALVCPVLILECFTR